MNGRTLERCRAGLEAGDAADALRGLSLWLVPQQLGSSDDRMTDTSSTATRSVPP
jgi:hypothetical protein